jgi:putative spermidine/putrescine transport system permease protein
MSTTTVDAGRRRRWRLTGASAFAWLLLPALVFYLLALFWPQVDVVRDSLTKPNGTFAFDQYARFFGDSYFRNVLWRTLRVSAITTSLTLLLGYPIAVYISQPWRWGRSIVTFGVIAPILVSAVARSYGWVIILGPGGLWNSALGLLGMGAARPLLFTEPGMIIAMTHVNLPFMVLPIAAALQQIDPAVLRASRILGAGDARTFLRVTLPLTFPGISAGATIVFCLSASSFVTPALIGGPTIPTMPYLIYQQGLNLLDWRFASAIAVILLISTATIVILHSIWSNRRQPQTQVDG